MTKYLIATSILLVFQRAYSQNNDIEVLKKLNEDWINSYSTKDTATLSRIFADDFILINPKGGKMTKSDIIKNIPKQEASTAHIDSVDVRLLTSDVGIITAYINFKSLVDGKDLTGQNCYQDVYIKRKKRWYAVTAHVTLLNMK